MSRALIIAVAGTGLLAATHLAVAQTEREHGSHVHGRSQINLALDEGQLELELLAPGMDVVGFEHAPRDDAQAEAIRSALAHLEDAGRWLSFEPDAACTVTQTKAHTHGYRADADADAHDHGNHDHGHEGQAAHDSHDHDHAEFHLRLQAECARAPKGLRITLSEQRPGMQTVQVDLITATRQDRIELNAGQNRVPLD